MKLLESPVKKSINNIRKTPTFKKSGTTGVKLATDFKSLQNSMIFGTKKLKRQKRFPTNKEIDKASMRILGQLRSGGGGAGKGIVGKSIIGAGLGALGGGLVSLAGGAVDIGSNLFGRGAKKGTAKIATKAAGKGIGKGLLKKLPLIGLGLGAAFAVSRAKDGDWVGAFGELASGAAAMVPGWGTAASVAIDAGLIAKDVNEANTSQDELDKKLDKKRNLIKVKTKSGEGLMPSLSKFESAVENFKSFSVKGSFSQDISPGTETDSLGKKDPNMHSGDYPGFDTMERVAPFTTGEVSTYPGAQYGASRSGGRTHVGQDISGQKAGDPVLSVMKGTVTEVGNGFTFQNGQGRSQTIGIDHPDGTHSRYVHIVSGVSVGDEVLTGQKIGTVSPADNASSPDFPHLHFELYAKGGGVIDPRPFLNSAPKGTPGVAPISASGDTELKPEKDGADDRESAPPTMDPTVDPGNDGYDMTRTRSGLLRSEISDDETGFTRGDQEDIKVKNERVKAMTKALGRDRFAQVLDNLSGGASVENYSAMMKAAGMTDQLKDILQQYRPGMLIDSGNAASTRGLVANDSLGRRFSVEAQQLLDSELPKIEEYPSYNQEGGGTTFVIMSDISPPQTQAPSPPMPAGRNSKPEVTFIPLGGGSLNRTMDELLLTKLSKS